MNDPCRGAGVTALDVPDLWPEDLPEMVDRVRAVADAGRLPRYDGRDGGWHGYDGRAYGFDTADHCRAIDDAYASLQRTDDL